MAPHQFPRPLVRAAGVAAILLGSVQFVSAQAHADSWSTARQRVEPGERVIFEAAGGSSRVSGLLQSISPEGLTVMVGGEPTHVRREDVTRLWKRGDSKLNGFLIGAGTSALLMGGLFAGFCDHDCGNAETAGVVALYSGLGGLVGLGIDALIDGKTLVYKRPAGVAIAPIVTPDRVGVQARLAW